AQEAGLPLALHVSGVNGYASTGSGYPSFYIEEHQTNVRGMQSVITSMVLEGVFEQFPGLKVVLVEGGVAWAAALKWRLDKHWRAFRDETPHLRRAPSEYVREHFWFTTQPLDEPPRNSDLARTFEEIGCDRVMFSTDYPHWDFDDPRFVLGKLELPDDKQRAIFYANACQLYGLKPPAPETGRT
ncbi:MAG: amidohydrolase, partial [Alphaproteobacteria bacterium]|nr:amidohydrolase [Alphaproteobacteria bacterium]